MSEFDRLLGEMEMRIDALVESTLERVAQRSPTWPTETAFTRRQVTEFARLSILAQLRALREETLPTRCPEVDATAARTVARVGELDAFASGYRAAQVVLWESWFCLVEDSGLDGALRRELLTRGSDFFFRYADLLGDFVADVYQAELRHLHTNGTQRRFNAAKAVLEGDPQSASAADLDLDLAQHHLGVIAWGEAAESAVRALATKLDRPFFLVSPLHGTWWAWISGTRPFEDRERRSLERLESFPDAGLALGLGEFGEHGFRTTHRQAQRARLLAPDAMPSLIRYADVAVEALASENQEEARNFVARELGAIDDDSSRSREIRDTLAAYFAAEHNAASAAATLGIHQQTVANRLRSAEERLGHSVGSRRLELELALRLRAAQNHQNS